MSYFSGFANNNCKVIHRHITAYSVSAYKYEATNIVVTINQQGDCVIEAHFKDNISLTANDKIVYLAKIDERGLVFNSQITAQMDGDWFYLGNSSVTAYEGTPGGYGSLTVDIESESHMFAQNDFLVAAFLTKSTLTGAGMVII